MILDRLFAAFALILVCGFLSIVVIWVPRPDLIIVTGIVVLAVIYDFYRELRAHARRRDEVGPRGA
ncbi:hypothetical protein [Lutibaculum baratangense]|uniref:Uncharacterized protein n=1 Tax=Lutibaculum baratangense AMV1 TaxID=631454 RepID=V4R3S4_9HYPH|nr:hypothetical protein [Lutibaculum baratangense]ESR26602.1 hypothetical protein N177_0821 [Lutibaculum baratangense AMV1]